MKLIQLLTSVSLALTGAAFAADGHNHAHEHKGLQGGVVAEANHLDFELVAKPDTIKLYVRDHDKPLSMKGASAKVTLLSGGSKTEVDLAPNGEVLEAKGTFSIAAGAKAVAVVSLPAKKVATVRFVVE
ncbi:hypothetical protein [Dechloromonas sp. ZS-1]|uniref:hypothetical protein n=1 Tax=Dechloromonas sp. ZS-1 TaxID=3138067 RepID=UPI0031FD60DF